MPLYRLGDKEPIVGEGSWIAPSAEIIGDVIIGKNCYIGFGAVIRADFGKVRIGDESSVEDNVVIHNAFETVIGNRVIVGHMAMIHDAVIKDGALIGMKSMICDNVVIGEGTIVAEQSLVRKNQDIPPGKICAGSPAKVICDMGEHHKALLKSGIQAYVDLTSRYHALLKKM